MMLKKFTVVMLSVTVFNAALAEKIVSFKDAAFQHA